MQVSLNFPQVYNLGEVIIEENESVGVVKMEEGGGQIKTLNFLDVFG